MRALLRIFPFLVAAAPARAHVPELEDAPPGWVWSAEPLVLIPLLALALLYALGLLRLWRRAGIGRGVTLSRAGAGTLGLAALLTALVSPLDAGAEASFALHMTQHMLLIVVAAPLLALGSVGVAILAALPADLRVPLGRRFAGRTLRRLRAWLLAVPVATAAHGAAVWLWHAPGLYEAALADPLVHYLEHLTMLGTAIWFWWSIIGSRWRQPLGYGAGVAALFLTMLHTGLLGILITLAPAPLYPSYAAGHGTMLAPLEDQQVAGIVMLLPGGLVYLGAGLALLAAWLDAAGRRRAAWP
jgi:cytochrome c oxidase assembly factor CtaG